MKYVSSGHSIKGSNCNQNEDCFLIKEEIGLHIVCDGQGEDGRGAIAAQMTTDFIDQVIFANKKKILSYKDRPSDELKLNIARFLEEAINKISFQVQNEMINDSKRRQMGTTVSMVLVIGNTIFLAHVGNSRIYLFRGNSIHQLTEDHDSKKLSKKMKFGDFELVESKHKDKELTRIIGSSQRLKVDSLALEVMSEDTLLLCTDGLSDILSEEKIRDYIVGTKENTLSKKIRGHVNQENLKNDDLAKMIMGNVKVSNIKDNVTAIAISFEQVKEVGEATTPQVIFSTLQKFPLFSQLNYKEMSKFMSFMKLKKFMKDENIVTEGENGEDLYIIISGTADVIVQNNILAKFVQYDYFGEISLVDKEPRMATVRASSNLEALILSKKYFDHILTDDPELSFKILWRFVQTLAARMRLAKIEILKAQKGAIIPVVEKIKLDLD